MAWPRLVMRLSTAPLSQDKMPSPAADWYTVMVTRSSAFAASNTTPATLLPISEVISEHCRSKAAHDCPATPYMSYSVAGCLAGAPGGRISASIPPVAASGAGTDGWQTLLNAPIMPLDPAAQNPSRPPISPMPGTWQTPPGAAGPASPVTPAGPAGWDTCAGAPAAAARAAVTGAPAACVTGAAGLAGRTAASAVPGRPTTAAMTPSSSAARRTGSGTRDTRGARENGLDIGRTPETRGFALAKRIGLGVAGLGGIRALALLRRDGPELGRAQSRCPRPVVRRGRARLVRAPRPRAGHPHQACCGWGWCPATAAFRRRSGRCRS